MRPLELDTVQAFTLIADLESFTRAAEAVGTTQSAVSMKLQRLEAQLGRRLIERTPRLVRLTPDGAAFLERARELLAAHERALAPSTEAPRRLRLGVSDHAAGPEFPLMLARVGAADPALALEVRIGFSSALFEAFDAHALDAVIVRREGARRGGEKLLTDGFGWFAAPGFRPRAGEPLRVAMLAAPCGIRAAAIKALEKARRPGPRPSRRRRHRGRGGRRLRAGGGAARAPHRTARQHRRRRTLGLPRLPAADVMLHARVADARSRAALRTLAAAFRAGTAASANFGKARCQGASSPGRLPADAAPAAEIGTPGIHVTWCACRLRLRQRGDGVADFRGPHGSAPQKTSSAKLPGAMRRRSENDTQLARSGSGGLIT